LTPAYDLLGDGCVAGSACSYDGPTVYTCQSFGELPKQEGEPCEAGTVNLPCAAGLICYVVDGDPECVAPAEIGDPCSGSCIGGELYCEVDTCIPLPGAGQPCHQGTLCNSDHYCDGGQGFTCQPRHGFGEGCGADEVCMKGLSCTGNVCTVPMHEVCWYVWE
jgi:hypothetical protein